LTGFFDFRDAFPVPIRLLAVIAVPALLAFLITNQESVSDTALKEQFVVLVALAMGFLMMAPRSGDALTGMGQTLTQARSR
jgi:phosphate starvation-inducible membrane PsiE